MTAKRLAPLLALLLPLTALADTLPFAYEPGATLSVVWDDSTKSDLVEGASLQAGAYKLTDAELVADGLAAGWRTGRVFAGVDAASVDPSTDWLVGTLGPLYFDGAVVSYLHAGNVGSTVWATTTRRLSDATNITSDGATINQAYVAKLNVSGTLATSEALAIVADYVADALELIGTPEGDSLADDIADLNAGQLDGAALRLALGLQDADLDDKFAALPTALLNAPWSGTPAEDTLAEQLAFISSLAGGANSQAAAAVSGIGDVLDALADLDVDVDLGPVLEAIAGIEGGFQPVAPWSIAEERTWRAGADGARADNVVTVALPFAGTLAGAPLLNRDADIHSVDAVTIAGPQELDAANLRQTPDGRKLHFDVPLITTAGTYEATMSVTTKDGQLVTLKGRLVAR